MTKFAHISHIPFFISTLLYQFMLDSNETKYFDPYIEVKEKLGI